jgi:serine/threonine protein kinase
VKLVGASGTLAGDILWLKSDLSRYHCDLEIIGNDVREAERKAIECEEADPDIEDCSEEVAELPLIALGPEKHFKKATTYKQEIRYLLQCQGFPLVVHLLGRTEEGAIVFPKFKRSFMQTLVSNNDQGRIQNIRRWMLEVIDGIAYLHSLGIIHRDLTMRNFLDLQCLHSTYRPFEIDHGDYTKSSFASDFFALGALLWESCFYNAPYSRHVLLDNPLPPPFHDIFVACTREKPEDRPTLTQLRAMYEAIG